MTRILFVSQPASEGVAVVVRQQVEAAIKAGCAVTVMCPSAQAGPLAQWITDTGARHLPVEMRRAPGPVDLAHLLEVRRAMRGADLVLLHSSKAGVLGRAAGMLMPRRNRPPVVMTPHAWSWSAGGRLAPLYRMTEKMLARRADLIVAVGDAEAEEGRQVLGERARLRTILNGVDIHSFRPEGETAATQGTTIVCVGRLAHQKGQDLAIEALSMMDASSVRLRLVGEGGLRADLEALASSRGVADRVEFVGYTDPRPHLRAAALAVVPSRWDGLSLALLEGMACGAPIVATRVAGSEVAEGAVRMVPPNDPRALAMAFDDLLADEAARMDLARLARERAELHDIRGTLSRTQAMWEELLRPE